MVASHQADPLTGVAGWLVGRFILPETVQSVKLGEAEIAIVRVPADRVAEQFVPFAREISSIAPVEAVVRPSNRAVLIVSPLPVAAPEVAALMSERTCAAVRVLTACPLVEGSPVNTAK